MALYSRDTKRRVKVYTLNPSLQWEDKGTGYVVVAVTSLQVGKAGPTVVVKSEKDGEWDSECSKFSMSLID